MTTDMVLSHEGWLTARDCKRHIVHSFFASPRSLQIDVRLAFEPAQSNGIRNLITLTLFDPQGFRGAGHRGGAVHEVFIGPNRATPGYTPGPLPAGEWIVQVDTHMIMPGEAVRYQLQVNVSKGSIGDREPARTGSGTFTDGVDPHVVPSYGPGWYRGDLHTHTHHSDAHGQRVGDLIAAARDHGLDFLFLTDHNTNAGLAELDASSSKDLLTVPGIELTTFWGHALCLGTRRWWDWRFRPGSGRMGRLAAEVEAEGGLFVIAHPMADGDPGCTGCAWRFGDMMPGNARWVEIWNGPWMGDSNNKAALSLWYDWLNQGVRIIATAGTDVHSLRHYEAQPGFSVIYAASLSQEDLLQALRKGHLYLSAGPQVDLTARDESSGQWRMGDTVSGPVMLP